MKIHRANHVNCPPESARELDRRALALWPALDRRALARCYHDVARVSRLVADRSHLPPSIVQVLLGAPSITPEDAARWFG